MTLWDEAQHQSEQNEREDGNAEGQERRQAAAQVQAVAEFIEEMKRLRIKPTKFYLHEHGKGRDLLATRGWDVDSPRKPGQKPHYFVTTKGQVHSFLKKRPEDLTQVICDRVRNDVGYYYFTDRLRDGIARAVTQK